MPEPLVRPLHHLLPSISPACTTGYGICAPLGLCWSCTDQVLRAKNLTVVKENQLSVLWHLPGMVLEPEWGNTANLTGAQFRFRSALLHFV